MAVNEIRYKGVSYATDDTIKVPSGVLYEAKALRSDSLEANSLTVTVYSSDKSIMDFAKHDKVEYFRNGHRVGVYYLQTVERVGSDSYTLSALSALGRLITMRHVGGIYTGQTVAEVVPQICGPVEVMIESVYASRQLYGYLPYSNPDKEKGNGQSARDNLAQVLFAIGAALGTDEDGVMRVEKLWDGVSCAITADQINEDSCSTVYETPVSAVEVTEHQWVQNQEKTTLFDGTAEEGTLVTFDDPAHDLTAEGFAITEQGDNYAILSAGTGTLTGKGYTHLTRIVRRTVTEGAEENVVAITDATLVSLTNSVDVANRMADYYSHRETIQVDVEPGAEHAGSVVQIYHPWDKEMVQACVESRETVISGILNSQTRALVGFTPQQPEASEYFSQRLEVLADREFTVPDGCTSLHIVAGSGGDGGGAGHNGEAGTDGGTARVASGSAGESVGTQGKGGKGGAAGLPGSGGKVLIFDVDVTPGDVVTIHIGTGGAPGELDGAAGNSGEATTVTVNGTVYSSADGSLMPAGYVDPTTGEEYAVTGDAGTPGGKGGDAQTKSAAAEAGENVGEYLGASGGSAYIDSDTPSNIVFDSFRTTRSHISSGAYGTDTGYPIMTNGEQGQIIVSGTKKTIGYSNGKYITGTVYWDVRNDSEPTTANTVVSSCYEGVCTEGDVTATKIINHRKYVKKTVQRTYGRLGSGGGAAAQGQSATNKAGANAAVPAEQTIPGSGGHAGHGGGGGGGGGAGYVKISGDTSSVSAGMSYRGASGGSAGLGSAGTKGADGFAILYYGERKTQKFGPLVTSDGKWLLDSLGRRIIV